MDPQPSAKVSQSSFNLVSKVNTTLTIVHNLVPNVPNFYATLVACLSLIAFCFRFVVSQPRSQAFSFVNLEGKALGMNWDISP